MSRWIVVCMFTALICGNQSESQYDDDEINESPSIEVAPDSDSYSLDTQHSTLIPKFRATKRYQSPIRNKMNPIRPYHTTINNQMADLYPEKLKRQPAKSNHPISDLIFQKDTLMNPSDSIETYHPPNKKSEKVDERRKRLKSTPGREGSRNSGFKKSQEHNREYNSASSDDESDLYKIPKRIPKLVTLKQVTRKKKREQATTEVIMHESELDASNDKFISEMKKENSMINSKRVTKKSNLDKHNHRHGNKDKHITKPERQYTLQPERILSSSEKMHKHKVESKIDFSKESKPNTHHSIKQHNHHEKHKENQHILKPKPAHLPLTDMLRQNKEPHQHKANKKNSPESQMNSLELEDAMAKPNGLLKPYEGNLNLKDEFTLTVVDINDTSKKEKTVYKFRDEGNQVPVEKIIENQNNVIPPINMPAAAEQAEYSVPLVPLKTNNVKINKEIALKPVEAPLVPVPEVEIGVQDSKNEHKKNSSVQKSKKDKGKTKSEEKEIDFSKAELHLTQSSEESGDEFAYIGYLSDKHNRGKKLKEILREASGKSDERAILRKSWLSCLGKKALKICIKSCNTAYKNVCKRLKCSTKARKDLKTQCKRSCKRVFKSNGGKYSDSSGSDSSGSSDSSF